MRSVFSLLLKGSLKIPARLNMKIDIKSFEDMVLDIMLEMKKPDYTTDVINLALSKLTKKQVYEFNFTEAEETSRLINSKVTSEDAKVLQGFYDEVFEKYKPETGSEYLTFRDVNKDGDYFYHGGSIDLTNGLSKNVNLSVSYNTMIIEDVVFIISTKIVKETKETYRMIYKAFYTTDSKDLVKEIWIKSSEVIYNLFKDRVEKPEEIYRVDTIFSDSDGNLRRHSLNVYPTASLSTDDFYDNYNKDLPVKKFEKFLDSDKGGICIFNGIPGCGKSTFLKSMIFRHPEVNFCILPQYLLLNQEAFRRYLLGSSNSNTVYIIEDCEQLLVQREENGATFASIIGDILNYSDGIIGDVTMTRFAFSFNTDLKRIDKAILRRGRLKLRYEFKPLIGENLEKIAKKVGYTLTPEDKKNGVSLADLYYNFEEVEIGNKSGRKKRIGYTVDECEGYCGEPCKIKQSSGRIIKNS